MLKPNRYNKYNYKKIYYNSWIVNTPNSSKQYKMS